MLQFDTKKKTEKRSKHKTIVSYLSYFLQTLLLKVLVETQILKILLICLITNYLLEVFSLNNLRFIALQDIYYYIFVSNI